MNFNPDKKPTPTVEHSETTLEASKLENEFQINHKMEIEAEKLGINLEKLQTEITKMGGVEKFRELADKGLVLNKETNARYGNQTDGEKVFQSKAEKLSSLRDHSEEKMWMIAGGAFTGLMSAVSVVGQINPLETMSNPLNDLGSILYTGEVTIFISMMTLPVINIIKKKIEASKQFITTKMTQMKLDMTNSQSSGVYLLKHDPAEKKLQEYVNKTLEQEPGEKEYKNSNDIGQYL